MSYSARRTILQVASGDIWAGAEVQMFYLCRQLNRSGTNVRVALFNDGVLARKLREEGIDVKIFDEKQLTHTQLLKSFIRNIRDVRPDVIHTWLYVRRQSAKPWTIVRKCNVWRMRRDVR